MAISSKKRSILLLRLAWVCLFLVLSGGYVGLEFVAPPLDASAIILELPRTQVFTHMQPANSVEMEPSPPQDAFPTGIERLGETPTDKSETSPSAIPSSSLPQSAEASRESFVWPDEGQPQSSSVNDSNDTILPHTSMMVSPDKVKEE